MNSRTPLRIGMAAGGLVLSLLISPPAKAQGGQGPPPGSPPASSEESAVKRAYMLLMLYAKPGAASMAEERGEQFNPSESLGFVIQNLNSGWIAEIYGQPLTSLVTKPTGYRLDVTLVRRQFENGPEHVMYKAVWAASPYSGSALEDWDRVTVAEFLELMGEPLRQTTRYTSYEVVARLAGVERTYKAIALHDGGFQSKPRAATFFIDNIVGSDALNRVMTEKRPLVRSPWFRYSRMKQKNPRANLTISGDDDGPVFPAAPGSRANPWSNEPVDRESDLAGDNRGGIRTAASCPIGTLEGSGGFGALCCDDFTMQCCFPYDSSTGFCDPVTCGYPSCTPEPIGGGGGGPSCNPRSVLGSLRERSASDTTYHTDFPAWGEHGVKTTLQGLCTYTSDCSADCSVSLIKYEPSESGIPSSLCHVYHKEDRYTDGSTTCSAVVGVGFKACLFCSCSIKVKFGPVEVSSDGFWTYSHQLDHQCSAL